MIYEVEVNEEKERSRKRIEMLSNEEIGTPCSHHMPDSIAATK